MPVSISDFVIMPRWAKYIVLIAVVLGATIEIPLTGLINIFDLGTDFSLGDFLFAPLFIALSFLGVAIDFRGFALLIIFGVVILAMLTFQKE